MTPTIDQFEILNNSVADAFFENLTDEQANMFLRSFPERNTDKFTNLLETDASNMLHVRDDLYLIRRVPGLQIRSCRGCAMYNNGACYRNFMDGDGEREIPCGSEAGETPHDGGYHLARLKTIAMPTNGKKAKAEYIPDTAASFDFSEENWKSVRSMIGM